MQPTLQKVYDEPYCKECERLKDDSCAPGCRFKGKWHWGRETHEDDEIPFLDPENDEPDLDWKEGDT